MVDLPAPAPAGPPPHSAQGPADRLLRPPGADLRPGDRGERSLLASALHDGVAQELALLGYRIDRLIAVLTRPEAAPPGAGLAGAQALRQQVTASLGGLRASLHDLVSPLPPGADLAAAGATQS